MNVHFRRLNAIRKRVHQQIEDRCEVALREHAARVISARRTLGQLRRWRNAR